VTPRERAEALGWVRSEGAWWVSPYSDDRTYPAGETAMTGPDRWSTGWRGKWIWHHPTEDEALAHALLLRDVVLS